MTQVDNELKSQHLIMPILDRIDDLTEKIDVLDELSMGLKEDRVKLEEMIIEIRKRYPTNNVRTIIKSFKLEV